MPKTREQKQKIIEALADDLKKAKSVVFVDYKGLKVKGMNDLRKKIKKVEGKLKAAKKTLIDLALTKSGFRLDGQTPLEVRSAKAGAASRLAGLLLTGQAALIFSFGDAIKPIKEVYDFSKKNENVKIFAGIFEGKFINKDEVISIAQLPSREELLSRLAGSIASPMSGLINVLQGNLRGLVLVLKQIEADKC